jgi:hypothetical protein
VVYGIALIWVGTGSPNATAYATNGNGRLETGQITEYDNFGYSERTQTLGTGKTDLETSPGNPTASVVNRFWLRAEA